jgi:signal transduction histidine kinase/CheY-like chemotaxis protein
MQESVPTTTSPPSKHPKSWLALQRKTATCSSQQQVPPPQEGGYYESPLCRSKHSDGESSREAPHPIVVVKAFPAQHQEEKKWLQKARHCLRGATAPTAVASILLVVGFVICATLLFRLRKLEESRLEALLDASADTTLDFITALLREASSFYMGALALANAMDATSSAAKAAAFSEFFFQFHDDLEVNGNVPAWVPSLTYVPLVNRTERLSYEEMARSVYINSAVPYSFREPPGERGAVGDVRADADLYAPALFQWPYDADLQGTDYLQGPLQIQIAMLQARTQRRPATSAPITLGRFGLPDEDGKVMQVLVFPVFGDSNQEDGEITAFILGTLDPLTIESIVPEPAKAQLDWVALVDSDGIDDGPAMVLRVTESGSSVLELTTKDILYDSNEGDPQFYVSQLYFMRRIYTVIVYVSGGTSLPTSTWILICVVLAVFLSFFAIVVLVELQKQRSNKIKAKFHEERQNVVLLQAKRAVDRAKAASRVLSSISHDIRTPMNGIMGAIQLLKQGGGLDGQQMEYLAICMSCSDSLLHLVNDFLDFNKMQSGTLVLDPCLTSVSSLLKDIASIYSLKSEEAGVTLEWIVTDRVPEAVMVDPWRVKQVLMNLVTNSFKFTPPGGRITVEADFQSAYAPSDEVPSTPGKANGMLLLAVTDTGQGVSKEHIGSIFRPFTQLHTGKSDYKGEGVGLGLAICRELVKNLMGGQITCESTPHVFTKFQFTVPLSETRDGVARIHSVGDEITAITSPGSDGSSSVLGKHLNLLVVDDSKVNLRILTRYLETGVENCSVQTAINGEDAVRIISEDPDISICLMDLNMPVMDGVDATRQIRQMEAEESRQRCCIIAVTAASLEDQQCDELLCAGFDDILSKPISRDSVIKSLRACQYRSVGLQYESTGLSWNTYERSYPVPS